MLCFTYISWGNYTMNLRFFHRLLVFVSLILLSGCFFDSDKVVLDESEVREQIKNHIKKDFFDPSSARFSQAAFSSYDPEERKFVDEFIPEATSLMFCGQVSGRNRFGGSTGLNRFAVLYSPPLDSESGPDIEVVYERHHLYESFSKDCP